MRTGVVGSVTWGSTHRWGAGRTALRSEAAGQRCAAPQSRQTLRTDAVAESWGRGTAGRNDNAMKANSEGRTRGAESRELRAVPAAPTPATAQSPAGSPFGTSQLYQLFLRVSCVPGETNQALGPVRASWGVHGRVTGSLPAWLGRCLTPFGRPGLTGSLCFSTNARMSTSLSPSSLFFTVGAHGHLPEPATQVHSNLKTAFLCKSVG